VRISSADVTGDFLDLKAIVTSLKNQLFMADQKRMDEVAMKNLEITKLEVHINEEQRRA